MKKSAKCLVLSCVFLHCFQHERELTVNGLLDANEQLSVKYGRHPQVLSNTLRRYFKQGLLYRNQDPSRGRPYYYGMTEKGFKRLWWMLVDNSGKYFFQDGARSHARVTILTQIISVLEKRKSLHDETRRQHIKELEELLRDKSPKAAPAQLQEHFLV